MSNWKPTVLEQAFNQASKDLLVEMKRFSFVPKNVESGAELVTALHSLNTHLMTLQNLVDEFKHKEELEKRIQ